MAAILVFLSTEWVDYVEEPMKYQAYMHHFFSIGGWLEGSWVGGGGGWVMVVVSIPKMNVLTS